MLRVVGHLPVVRGAVVSGDDLRAGVAQASREETAACTAVLGAGQAAMGI